jgi:glycosyltransferase involved in cell wall biosynthesis
MKVAITMPVYNEEGGIYNFLVEINEAFKGSSLHIVAVNDSSTDDTSQELLKYSRNFRNLDILENSKNCGHGPSTLRGMAHALNIDCDYIITVDGDGQFYGHDIFNLYRKTILTNVDVAEGVRIQRTDPAFRKISTLVVRLIVLLSSGKLPKDGNTPLRIYKKEILKSIFLELPTNLLVPNMFISILSRRSNLRVLESETQSLERRGGGIGTTWKQKFAKVPSRRFIKFCFKAFFQFAQEIGTVWGKSEQQHRI